MEAVNSNKDLIKYYTKLMKAVPKDEPRHKQIVQAYKDHIQKLKLEDKLDNKD